MTSEPNKVLLTSTPTSVDLSLRKNSPISQPPRVRPRPTSRPPTLPNQDLPTVDSTTPSTRELRVKINQQVAAFLNRSSSQRTPERNLERDQDWNPMETKEEETKTDFPPPRDCSDLLLRGHTGSGEYPVTPEASVAAVTVRCEMAVDGGGWTVLQRRQDGGVSFNRSWAEYRGGFGSLRGEFWLGLDLMHLLTRDRDMELRLDLEDWDGVRGHAVYQLFRVGSERLRYRLSVDGYSGTAGDALRFSPQYDHHHRFFTTPDRDNDRYPSGNCGSYYGSGWWFDACMAANLNGRYHRGRYRGVRDGIYWGTWHNISSEYYPTNERVAFRAVSMMTRPRGFKSRSGKD